MTKTLSIACVVSLAVIGSAALLSHGSTAATGQAPAKSTPAPKSTLSADALDQLLAPIALYPDALLSNMLMCTTDPGKVGALDEWLRSQSLSGSALQDAATAAGFEPSFVALTIFPDVVAYMARQTDWTRSLGQAFTTDRSAVFASIQRLRNKARAAGTLKTTPQQNVETRTASNGQEVIVIEPANPQVIYVPQYNPTVVYTQPSTTVVVESSSSSANAVAAGVIGFTAGIAIGAAIDNDYYYGPYGMRGGFYMYDDAWDDWYDAREDARDDWMDHREDLYEERGEQRENLAEERTERRSDVSEQRTERQGTAQEQRTARQENRQTTAQSGAQTQSTRQRPAGTSQEARGYSGNSQAARDRSGTSSDAFSGYSNGRSERAASERGSRSRSSSRGSSGSSGRRR